MADDNSRCRCQSESHLHEPGDCRVPPIYLVTVPSGAELACCERCMGARIRHLQADSEVAKDPAAVTLGRRGGIRGGVARAKALTADERSELASKAARARWDRSARGGNTG